MVNSLPFLLVLGAALCWAVAQTVTKLGLFRMDAVHYAATRAAFALLFVIPYGIGTGGFRLESPGLIGTAALAWWTMTLLPSSRRRRRIQASGLWIVFAAATGFFLGWILWLSGLRLAQASLLTPIRGGTMTLFAFGTSIALLRERPTQRAWLGAALACGGVVLASVSA